MDSSNNHDQTAQTADAMVERYIHSYCQEHEIAYQETSQTKYILQGLLEAALTNRNASERETDEADLAREFNKVLSLVDDLRAAVTPDYERGVLKLDFWNKSSQPFVEIRRHKKALHIDLSLLEDVTYRYLHFAYRYAPLDRLLVEILVATDMYAYGEIVLLRNSLETWMGTSQGSLFARPIWGWFVNQILNLVVLGVIGAGTWFAVVEWIGNTTASWMILCFTGIWLLLFVLSIICLPSHIYRTSREKDRTIRRIEAMQTAFTATREGILLSSRHITQRLESAAEHDVIWPSILFVLLDDITSRGGRF